MPPPRSRSPFVSARTEAACSAAPTNHHRATAWQVPQRSARARERYRVVMTAAVAGVVHGNVIELDEPVPGLEGRRVRVLVEPVDEATADRAEQQRAWEAWAARGPQGPIEDDGEPELP